MFIILKEQSTVGEYAVHNNPMHCLPAGTNCSLSSADHPHNKHYARELLTPKEKSTP